MIGPEGQHSLKSDHDEGGLDPRDWKTPKTKRVEVPSPSPEASELETHQEKPLHPVEPGPEDDSKKNPNKSAESQPEQTI
ncbi:MAG: hypothetical protein HW405_795 [Candidatus Berkelbacteria bacterium]|nr:hypothetical protein [Candidatus Berkelbacteria bacterium]